MTETYKASDIVTLPWPRWAESSPGGWEREWRITFISAPSEAQWGALGLTAVPGVDIDVVAMNDEGVAVFRQIASGNPNDDQIFYGAAYEMLKQIDGISPIARIQGLPRDVWAPFRAR